jgi:hypothetical protein
MSRQRKVFPRETVAHLWAHKAQDSARDPSGNFYFTGASLYSYGSHFIIAHHMGDEWGPELAGRVLWNEAGYSKTTANMKSIAWRAMTQQQRAESFDMPGTLGMGRNVDPRDIERALSAKKLPAITESLLRTVSGSVMALIGKRYGSGPFESLLSEARKAEKLARAFYNRAGRKYPLPLIESRPVSSDKTEWQAWIKSISAHLMRDDYQKALKAAKDYAAQADRNAAECADGFPYAKHAPGCEWEARNIVGGTYDVAQRAMREIEKAQSFYKVLNGKAGPVSLKKTAARMAELAEIFKARRDEFTRRETQNRVIYDIRRALLCLREPNGITRPRITPHRRSFADMETLSKRASECGMSAETHPLYFPLAVRLSRIGTAQTAREALKDAADRINTAREYMPQFPGDARRCASEAINKLAFITRLGLRNALMLHWAKQIVSIRAESQTLAENAHAAILAKHAETLRAWLAGESNARPSHEAGTFARIKGDVIETTRGASVPIAHACRLSRLYSIIVRRGGQEWRDGSGPIVGHYRVNRIGADGSLIIGCHEFDATEAKRLHALLSECAECQKETAETE